MRDNPEKPDIRLSGAEEEIVFEKFTAQITALHISRAGILQRCEFVKRCRFSKRHETETYRLERRGSAARAFLRRDSRKYVSVISSVFSRDKDTGVEFFFSPGR